MKYQFTDVQFMSSEDKQKVLKQWEIFLKNGLKLKHFTKRLYQHLNMHCSFIAHYNLYGFYDTYFVNGADTLRFLSQFDSRGDCAAIEYGGTYWMRSADYGDLAKAMIEVGSKYIPVLIIDAIGKQKNADLAQSRKLTDKYGYHVVPGNDF